MGDELAATVGALRESIKGLRDAANALTMEARRLGESIDQLDRSVGDLPDEMGLVVEVRERRR